MQRKGQVRSRGSLEEDTVRRVFSSDVTPCLGGGALDVAC